MRLVIMNPSLYQIKIQDMYNPINSKVTMNKTKNIRYILLLFFIGFANSSWGQTYEYNLCDQSNDIVTHLNRVSAEITNNSLSKIKTRDDWEQVRSQYYRNFVEMMGIEEFLNDKLTNRKVNYKLVGKIQMDGYHIQKLWFESFPGLHVPANVYIPNNIVGKAPAIVYLNGHNSLQKVGYQSHAHRFAKCGYICIIFETLELGETQGIHRGEQFHNNFNWYSRGYSSGSIELINSICAVDILCQMPQVDTNRIGATGISGGGAYSFYLAAVDNRIKAVAPVCGGSTLESHIGQRTIDQACDCMTPTNTYLWDYSDIGALIAPRPMLIAQADKDWYFSLDAVKKMYGKIKTIYDIYNNLDQLSLLVTPGAHAYHELSLVNIINFFNKHFNNGASNYDKLADIDKEELPVLSEEELSVFGNNIPKNDIHGVIQDVFTKKASIPTLNSITELTKYRDNVKEKLLEKSFLAFPEDTIPFNVKHTYSAENADKPWRIYVSLDEYTFCTEKDWRLKITLYRNPQKTKRDLLVLLKHPTETTKEALKRVSPLKGKYDIAIFETRGVGDTGWNSSLDRFVRRAAAWTGRTVASMRIYDTLRCLSFIRNYFNNAYTNISIGASNEMCVVAMYTALMDGNVQNLLMMNLPRSQDTVSENLGESFEILNSLQIIDLPQLAGALYPIGMQFVGEYPSSYEWAKQLYKRFGYENKFCKIKDVSQFVTEF